MWSRIFDSLWGEPCSCGDIKHCPECRARALKPQVHLEDPHRLSIPIVISHYKHRSPTTIHRATEKRWPVGTNREKTPARPTALCSWVRKKRLQRQLQLEKKREKERQKELIRREKEIEFIEKLHEKQRYHELDSVIKAQKKQPRPKSAPKPKRVKAIKEPPPPPPPRVVKEKKVKERKVSPPPPPPPVIIEVKEKKEKEKKVKPTRIVKATVAKPQARAKVVSVNRYCQQPLSVRFVNCCYRCCCQLYCCLTVLLIIGLAIILLV